MSILRSKVSQKRDTLQEKWHKMALGRLCAEKGRVRFSTQSEGEKNKLSPDAIFSMKIAHPNFFLPSGAECWFLLGGERERKSSLRRTGMKSCTRAACLYPISFARVHKNGNKLLPGFLLVDHYAAASFFARNNNQAARWTCNIVLITRHRRCILQHKRIISIITAAACAFT